MKIRISSTVSDLPKTSHVEQLLRGADPAEARGCPGTAGDVPTATLPACGQRLDACVCSANNDETRQQGYAAPRHEAVKTPDQHYSESLRADLHTKPRRAHVPATRARFEAARDDSTMNSRGRGRRNRAHPHAAEAAVAGGLRARPRRRAKKKREAAFTKASGGRIVGARASPGPAAGDHGARRASAHVVVGARALLPSGTSDHAVPGRRRAWSCSSR